MRRRPLPGTCLPTLAAAMVASAWPAWGAVSGTVRNGTTGAGAPGVTLTLSSFLGGMTPLEETVTDTDGRFAFEKELPAVATGQPFAGAIRAELDGINYTEILGADDALDAVTITVYSASAAGIAPPSNRVVILEPGGEEMVVRESFQFFNNSEPPVTYSTEDGTLRFYLPDEAKGVVQVSGTGPAGMPLRSTALPAGEDGLYKVDFPLKPGENRIDLSYLVPFEEGTPFVLRSLYPDVATRVAAPEGVEISGESVQLFGREPSTNAAIYSVTGAGAVALTVSGQGTLRREAPSGSSSAEISIQPAPIARELVWIAGLTILILGLGFVHLLTSRQAAATGRQARKEA